MSHPSQVNFCLRAKSRFPKLFRNSNVLDVGSLDINGSNRYLFEWGSYLWMDLWEGKNVDLVCKIEDYVTDERYDVVISTEMLEHCREYDKAIQKMGELTKKWGLLLITCAWEGRPEHWTTRTSPKDAPFTNDWYRNILHSDFHDNLYLQNWEVFEISTEGTDIRFIWIKK